MDTEYNDNVNSRKDVQDEEKGIDIRNYYDCFA